MSASQSYASRLRHRVTLQQEVRTADTGGGYTRSWEDVADLWAEIVPLTGGANSMRGSGHEILFAGQLQAVISHRIMLRYRDGVTPAMRLLYENRVFNIHSVADVDEKHDMLSLLVVDGAAG